MLVNTLVQREWLVFYPFTSCIWTHASLIPYLLLACKVLLCHSITLPSLVSSFSLLFRWFARIEKNLLVKICAGIFLLVAITIALKLVMP